MSMDQVKNWVGQDTYQFIMTRIGLLGAREEMVGNDDFHKLLVAFANAMYYGNLGRMTHEVMDKFEKYVREAQTLWYVVFTEECYWWKGHIFGHAPEFVRRFGPLHVFDAFILEYSGGQLKRNLTARVGQTQQVVTQHLLMYHNVLGRCSELFNKDVAATMKVLGYNAKTSARMRIRGLTRPKEEDKQRASVLETEAVLIELARHNIDVPEKQVVGRWSSIKFGVTSLCSSKKIRKGEVDNSFVQIDREFFGSITDIFDAVIDNKSYFMLKVVHFDPVELTGDSGAVVLFPDNQRPRQKTGKYSFVLLHETTFVQKAVCLPFPFTRERVSNTYTLFSILPHMYSVY